MGSVAAAHTTVVLGFVPRIHGSARADGRFRADHLGKQCIGGVCCRMDPRHKAQDDQFGCGFIAQLSEETIA